MRIFTKMKILLAMTAVLLFGLACGTATDTTTDPKTDITAADALSKRAGCYANGDLMLEISSSGDVNFSNTGEFKDAEKVVIKKLDNAGTTFTFNYKTINYILKFGKNDTITLNNNQLTKTTKLLTLADRVGFYINQTDSSIMVAVSDTGNIWPTKSSTNKDFATNSTQTNFIINSTTTITFNSLTSLTYIDTSTNINALCVQSP